jgi:hypothetical protein
MATFSFDSNKSIESNGSPNIKHCDFFDLIDLFESKLNVADVYLLYCLIGNESTKFKIFPL